MVYTGITRAKKECCLIYEKEALELSVTKRADDSRESFLAEKLIYLDAQMSALKNLAA
jgi:ATP-dependent exoDNAse (exonuclease V) alpha subunit